MPVASPSLPRHQNLRRLLVSSGREGDNTSLWTSPHQRPELQTIRQATYLPKPANSGRCRGQAQCCAGCCQGVLLPPPRRWHMSVCPSPAHLLWRSKGRGRITATHRAQHQAEVAPPGSPKPSAVPVSGTDLHSRTPTPMLFAHTASCPAAPTAPSQVAGKTTWCLEEALLCAVG